MRIEYTSPEFELIKLSTQLDVLALSDPETPIGGGGSGQGPSPDPFNELTP